MACVSANDRHWFDTFVSRCQAFAGRALDASPGELSSLLLHLSADIPDDASLRQRFAVRSMLGRIVAGLGRLEPATAGADIARAFLEWSASDLAVGEWRLGLTELVSRCAAALECSCDGRTNRPYARCAAKLLDTIKRRFADPGLTMEVVASESGASVRHAARVLKGETGQTFLAHLHHARIAAACEVLRASPVSIKEAAVAVGYVSSSEFGKHFKRLVGTTPARFRLGHGAAPGDGGNAR